MCDDASYECNYSQPRENDISSKERKKDHRKKASLKKVKMVTKN